MACICRAFGACVPTIGTERQHVQLYSYSSDGVLGMFTAFVTRDGSLGVFSSLGCDSQLICVCFAAGVTLLCILFLGVSIG